MENLMKRTKAELIQTIANMKSTIEARDKSINEMKDQLRNNTRIANENYEIKVGEVERLKGVIKAIEENKVGEKSEEAEFYKRLYEKRTKDLKMYYTQHGNILKILSGVVGQSLELNEYMDKEVNKDGTKS